MPVRKFRSLEAMEDSLWREPGDPALWRAIERVWRFAAETCPRRFPPGAYRHRSIEEAKRQREVWDEANFRAFWERRRGKPADTEVSGEHSLHEESPDGVDLTLIRWTLGLTPLERLEVLQDWVDGLTELRRGRVPER
jgi:hypothetical protein